ncbi:MAG TPA: GWxTD domain-containing protein [Vicinamibacteria bacterium]|nr:GWxTD domain-containing protein [Vicinamibacteria bacterium]
MTGRSRRVVLVLFLLAAAAVPAFSAGPRDVDTKRFPRVARIFLLPEEAALLKELKDEKDRQEFQKIFWARRDPTPGTPANEFQDNVLTAWSRSDDSFSYPGRKGSETGCGQVFALLGRPEEIVAVQGARSPRASTADRQEEAGTAATKTPPAGPGPQFDNMAYLREGSTRQPEAWVYRDRPGLPYHFTGAELRIEFDAECGYAEGGGILGENLQRAAAAYVTRPDLGYARGADGHLLPLAAVGASSGASAGARALLASPRTDFPLTAELKLLTRAPRGEAYAAGLVSAPPASASGPTRLSIAAQAKDAGGQTVASTTRDVVAAEVDGAAVASWGLALKPGRYRLTVAAALPDGKGSATTVDLEVPDLGGGALVASPLVLYPDEPAAGKPDAHDPLAAFQIGAQVLRPRPGNAFTAKDALMVLAGVYGGRTDPATGQAALRSRFTILKDGKPVARGSEDVFTTADAVASVGPIQLNGFAPGAYVVRLDVNDTVARQTLRQEAPLTIKP